jgi:hypothetical protein
MREKRDLRKDHEDAKVAKKQLNRFCFVSFGSLRALDENFSVSIEGEL